MANNDDQMKRFLFAILKQKNLKDIDWNQVAHDPVLAQPITNGHAARMRYSRFRQQMLGLEPQKRNRTGQPKSKVSKNKKEIGAKREDGVKPEPDMDGYADANSHFTPTSASSPSMLDCHSGVAGRLLTPCSDDMMASAQGIDLSSPNDLFNTQYQPFDLAAAAEHAVHNEHLLAHAHGSWTHSPVYSAFDAALDMGQYDVNMCEHQHAHNHPAELLDADAPGEPDDQPVAVVIKREEMGTHFHT